MAIPASQYVAITPGVIGAGGTALALSGLVLTGNTRVPFGTVPSFPSAAAVGAYFGLSSNEYAFAQGYFQGPDNSLLKPGALLFAQWPTAPVAGYLRGSNVSGLTTSQLQAINGTLTVTVNGSGTPTTGTVNLAAATSFTSAAAIIQTALGAGVAVTYDSVSGAFLITSATTGASSAVGYGGGSAALALGLTQANGAVLSAGAIGQTPGAIMSLASGVTSNWATFASLSEPTVANKVSFAQWNNSQGNRYVFVNWSTEAAAYGAPDTTSSAALILAASYSGTASIYAPVNGFLAAAFAMGFVASINYAARNGNATLAFKTQGGLQADVTSQTIAAQLVTNGYNYYGLTNTAAQTFTFCYPGSISGPYNFLDNYINQIQLTNALQQAMLTLLASVGSVPYNSAGYGLIKAAAAGPINAAVNFGSIASGVTLSPLQAAELNAAAGLAIDSVVSSRGWYLQINPASAQVRAARGSPPMTLWYTSPESVQAINLGVVTVL